MTWPPPCRSRSGSRDANLNPGDIVFWSTAPNGVHTNSSDRRAHRHLPGRRLGDRLERLQRWGHAGLHGRRSRLVSRRLRLRLARAAAGRVRSLGASVSSDTDPEPRRAEELPRGAVPEAGKPVSPRAERGARMTPAEAVRDMRITLPARGNRTLRDLIDKVNRRRFAEGSLARRQRERRHPAADQRPLLGAHPDRHQHRPQAVRELRRAGVEPGMVTDYGMRQEDAEVVVALGCLTHCLGMAIHRTTTRR